MEAAGVKIKFHGQEICFDDLDFEKRNSANLVEMADGLADTMVICAGGLAICGIADVTLLREVDDNNLLKIATGHLDTATGKFIKPKNHPKPDIASVLKAQGWETHENVHVPCGG